MIFGCTFKSRNGLLESCLEKGPFKTHEIGLALITIQLTFKKKNIKKKKFHFSGMKCFQSTSSSGAPGVKPSPK